MSPRPISLLYRGELASCNYDCAYCPFAKRRDSRETLARDAADLARFVAWISEQSAYRFNILFTPWGEGLTRKHYRDALLALSRLPQVLRVAIQTNLSTAPGWLEGGEASRISLWCTFHPSETNRARFLRRIGRLAAMGVPHSVGMVGLREFFPEIEALRQALPGSTYLWINAYHDQGPGYYRPDELAWLNSIDPWFSYNAQPVPSAGAPCQAGETALSIDGQGNIKRCHFVPAVLGNIYTSDWQQLLRSRTCPNAICDCYIGYVHRDDLPFATAFGVGALGRVPPDFHWQATASSVPCPRAAAIVMQTPD